MGEEPAERRETFGAWLRRQREERGVGIDRAARESRIAATTLRRIELGAVPSIAVARQISRGLGLDLGEVFRRVGYPLGLWNDRRAAGPMNGQPEPVHELSAADIVETPAGGPPGS
jgi:transcriptional regulator with XRE-family HTH domain